MKLIFAGVIGAICLTASSVSAEPITLKGLNWSMDYVDMINQLNGDGFQCVGENRPFSPKDTPEGKEIVSYLCEKNSSRIRISANDIRFDCSVFDMCNYPAQSAAQKLVDDGKVEELTPRVAENQTMAIIAPEFSSYVEWCGTGSEGDGVCVVSNSQTDNLASIVLRKGAIGKKLSFD